MAVENLLSRLENVKPRGNGRFMARCPAHADRTASLSIRQEEDGRVLIHCFALCSAHDVVSAVGLELSDLFPERSAGQHASPIRNRISAADALRAVSMEALVVCAAATTLASGDHLPPRDRKRLMTAAERIQHALTETGNWQRSRA